MNCDKAGNWNGYQEYPMSGNSCTLKWSSRNEICTTYCVCWGYQVSGLMVMMLTQIARHQGSIPIETLFFLFITHYLLVLSCKHTKCQPPSGSFEVLTLGLMHENWSGTNFGASQCISMGPCCYRLMLSVFIPLDMGTSGPTKRTNVTQTCLKAYILKSWDWDWNTL